MIEGDNQGIIYFQAGISKLQCPITIQLLEQVADTLTYTLDNVTWKKIPRDINVEADHLAGLASQIASDIDSPPSTLNGIDLLDRWNTTAPAVRLQNELLALETGANFYSLPISISFRKRELNALELKQEGHLNKLECFLKSHPSGNGWILYHRYGSPAQSRSYAVGFCPQALPSALRTIILGDTHWEADISQSTMAFFLSVWHEGESLFPQCESVGALKHWIANLLIGTADIKGTSKAALHRLIAADEHAFLGWLRREQIILAPPQSLIEFVRAFNQAKSTVLRRLHARGIFGAVRSPSPRNELTRALEAAEQLVINAAILHVGRSLLPSSIIPLGDAIYFCNKVPQHSFLTISTEIATRLGFPKVHFRVSDLKAAKASILAHVDIHKPLRTFRVEPKPLHSHLGWEPPEEALIPTDPRSTLLGKAK